MINHHIITSSIVGISRCMTSIRMTLYLLFIIYYVSYPVSVSAQQTGTWKIYPSYMHATKHINVGNRVYALMESKLMAYDTSDGSITTFDWMKQLNDIAISYIYYSAEARRIIIIYDNGNIDLLSTTDDSDVINLAHLKNSLKPNKTVNHVKVHGTLAYVCTEYGFVVVDMSHGVIKESYELDLAVKCCAITDESVFAGTSTGLWVGKLSDNLKDKSNWVQFNSSYNATDIEYFDGLIWMQIGKQLLKSNDDFTTFSTEITDSKNFTYMSAANGYFIIGNDQNVYIYSSKDNKQKLTGTYTWNYLTCRNKTYWASDGEKGLQAYQLNTDGTFSLKLSQIHPNSPLHDYSLHLNRVGNRILVAGGQWNYSATSRPGTAMILEPDGTWINFDATNYITDNPSEKYQDVTQVVQDPQDASHFYVGTSRSGIFDFRNNKCVGHIGLENSPLKSILPTNANPQWFVVADGINYDKDGHLWILNPTAGKNEIIIHVRKKNGQWTTIPCPEIEDASTTDRIFFDSRGYAWINSRRMSGRGVCVINYNGTIDNTSDDRRKLFSTIVNQDNTSYTPDQFYTIAEDLDGSIWIGTELGPFVTHEPNNFQASNFTFEQVKISRNDGSGLADYLFNNIAIRSIAVDGAGRKWFGTENNGVYLISEDCQEQIYHFNTENSPLPSDMVDDILIHPTTGVVYFATEKGICSYASDATQGADELDKDLIYAYPNPVEADYHGLITVKGLVKDCEVKIISTTGQLIWSGQSKGGTFTWNGLNQSGRRVASGIYTIIANTSDGEEAATTKLTIIR